MNWLTASEICKELRITSTTLHNWRKAGKLSIKKLSVSKFLYDLDHITGNKGPQERHHVIYARVSNTKQKDDLQRQIQILKEYIICNGRIPGNIYSDIASGMNEDRDGFNKLINSVIKGEVDTVYISYKDRLVRFGFGYFEKLFEKYNTKIQVVNLSKEEDFQNELVEDLTSIIHHFSMKLYSNRRKELKATMKIIEREMHSV